MIDDEAMVCRALSRALGRTFDVTCVGDAESALALLDGGQRFHAILCDLHMGTGIGGRELYDRVLARADGHAARTIIMSGEPPDEEAPFDRALSDRWLVKPTPVPDLLALLERIATPADERAA